MWFVHFQVLGNSSGKSGSTVVDCLRSRLVVEKFEIPSTSSKVVTRGSKMNNHTEESVNNK
jgi:hypothetical protein